MDFQMNFIKPEYLSNGVEEETLAISFWGDILHGSDGASIPQGAHIESKINRQVPKTELTTFLRKASTINKVILTSTVLIISIIFLVFRPEYMMYMFAYVNVMQILTGALFIDIKIDGYI